MLKCILSANCHYDVMQVDSKQYTVMSKLEVLYYCSISIDIVGGFIVALKFKVQVRTYSTVQDSDPRP